jgi:hypothetical protein
MTASAVARTAPVEARTSSAVGCLRVDHCRLLSTGHHGFEFGKSFTYYADKVSQAEGG